MPLSISSGPTNNFQTEKHSQNQAFSPQISPQIFPSESSTIGSKRRRAITFIERQIIRQYNAQYK